MMSRRIIPISHLKRSGGFTLLEVLLAFVIFALSFATVMEIQSGSIRNTVRAREYSEVALIAQSVMDQVGLEIALEQGTTASGESGDYEWEIMVDLFEDPTGEADSVQLADLTGIELLRIDLVITWGESPREKYREFTTVRAMLEGRVLLD
jgi:general secretion pathway protein I